VLLFFFSSLSEFLLVVTLLLIIYSFSEHSSLAKVKDEKRPWILRAREAAVHVDNTTTEEGNETWPETLIYISCGWESFKRVLNA
jgi:predicted membrane protein